MTPEPDAADPPRAAPAPRGGGRRRVVASALAMLLAIAALVTLNLQTADGLARGVAEADRAGELRSQAQAILVTLLDIETSQRGYLLTLAPSYLGPYQAGLARLDRQLDALATATAGQPAPAGDLAALRGLVAGKRAELAQTLTLADTVGVARAVDVVRNDSGKALMDRIRAVLGHLDTLAADTLAQRRAERADSLARGRAYGALLVAAIGLMLLALYGLARRERALQARVLAGEATARHELAQRVRARTAELEDAARSRALSEARLRGIFDSATDAILTVDESQCIVEANASAGLLFGCGRDRLIGAPLDQLLPERFRTAHRHDVQAFGASADHARRMGPDREVLGLRAGGEEFPVEAGISHVELAGRHLYTVVLRDVTRRRRDEAALRASNAKLEATLASMNDAVLISDAEGHALEFNDAFIRFHRFRHRDECRRTLQAYPEVLEAFLPDGTPVPLADWAVPRALRGEVASNVEFGLRRRDTGEQWVGSFSFAPIRSRGGEVIGAVVTGRDVTALKQAQADLESSQAQLRRLVANQHHIQEHERRRIARELHDDLQQSLAAIRMDVAGAAERLADGRGDAAPLLARIDRLTAAAIASTRRIVSDLRPEMLEDLGLAPALEQLLQQFAERSGAQVRLAVSAEAGAALDDAPDVVTALYRVTQEALNNVAKHAHAGHVSVTLDGTPAGLLVLRVTDDGIGLPRDGVRRPGSFGLAGMAERVRALGGQLRVARQPRGGTLVEVLVPMDPPRAAPDAPAAGLPEVGALAGPGTDPALQALIDALAGSVCVLDRQGGVRLVNQGWRRFAERHGGPAAPPVGLGANYLDVCRRSAQADPSLRPLLEGLDALLAHGDGSFVAEYPCDTPDGRRWFRLHAAALAGGLAIVSHIDLTPNRGPDPAAVGTGGPD